MNGQLQVKAVLKRGLEYGILRKYRRQYYLPTSNELNRANRIALRFAKLPLPSTYQTKSRSFYSLRSKRRNSRKSNVKSSRKAKQLADFSSTLISPTVSLANTICNVDDLWTIHSEIFWIFVGRVWSKLKLSTDIIVIESVVKILVRLLKIKGKKKSDRKRRSSFILVSCNNERIVINNKRKYCETQKLLYLTCTYLGIYTYIYIYRVHNLSSFVSLDEKSQSCSE